VVDGHVHIWTLDPENYPWQPTLAHVPIPDTPATDTDLLVEMDCAKVELAVLVQPSVYGWDNSYLCRALDEHPGRFAGVCLVDPRSNHGGEELRYWCQVRGCRGVRVNLIAEDDPSWVLASEHAGLFEEARSLGVSVSLQIQPRHAGTVLDLARRHQHVTFVVDYLGPMALLDGTGAQALEYLASRPNIWFKLLAVGPDSKESYPFADLWPAYQRGLDAFGPERVIFGTDFPYIRSVCPYSSAVEWLAQLPFLGATEKEAVGDTNARRLFATHAGRSAIEAT
jgi:predicted TIM-barrel fold metal-dependent hydrolase